MSCANMLSCALSKVFRYAGCNPWIRCSVNSPSLLRFYHAKDGVYGFKPNQAPPESAKVDLNYLRSHFDYGTYRLVTAYREHGHLVAQVDLLNLKETIRPEELSPERYGIDSQHLHSLRGLLYAGPDELKTDGLVALLDELYCGPVAAEFQHIQNVKEREWFARNFEQLRTVKLSDSKKIHFAELMLKGQAFDHFLANKFTTVKRYGGEGAESALVFYDELFSIAANSDIDDVVMCIAHRGRLNLLTCLLKYPPVVMFQKMKGKREFPPDIPASGDVLSHLTSSVDLDYSGHSVHVTMLPNPSHLEAVNPVCAGKTRARMQSKQVGDYDPSDNCGRSGDRVLCLQVHGDAAFAGQGVVAETFLMANLPHYSVGGTIHFIINNQVGYTTTAELARSSEYSSDVGKVIGCPVLRVNGDHPEEVVKACRLAMAYREAFRKDVIIDYICYRKWGHNELDEPGFTQPIMYNVIRNRSSIPDAYAAQLLSDGVCTSDELSKYVSEWNSQLSQQLSLVDTHVPQAPNLLKHWSGMVHPSQKSISVWDTGVPVEILKYVGAKSCSLPPDFNIHPTLQKSHIEKRLQKLVDGKDLDWATGEALAIGSLLYQGFNVRISGQDVGRGTFSQRHAMFVDQMTDAIYIPLNNMQPQQTAFFEVANSPLSEEAVLGFEYGMSIENPRILPIWEAQFGDFFNGAQIVIDTFITGGETKWLTQSALTLILPHGLDGAGPEHSSCKIERFLQACDSKEDGIDSDDVNIQVVYPTNPAQYFHLLRRQMVRNFRKPMVVIGPKMILRHPAAVSTLDEMAPGTTFRPVLSDPGVGSPQKVTRVVFMTGKHFYALDKERQTRGVDNIAFVRLESLCPFPAAELQAELKKFPKAEEFVWCQEEHRNAGAWFFVAPRFENVIGVRLRYVGRPVSPIPAAGVGEVHSKEAKDLVEAVFAAKI